MKSLTPGEQFIFDWQYDNLDSFHQKLIECMIIADNENLHKVGSCYKEELSAFIYYRNTPGWWEDVDDRGNGEPQEHDNL